MRSPLFLFILAPFFFGHGTASAQNNSSMASQDIMTDFEISFLSDYFGAIRLPDPKVIRSGDIVRLDNYRLEDRISNCVADFEDRYSRSDTPFQLTSENRSRSGKIEANVKALFQLRGEVSVSVNSRISDDDTFNLNSDDVAIEYRRAGEIISSSESCGIFRDLYLYYYIPDGLAYIDQAFFFGGNVKHWYQLSLSGSGSGSIGTGRLAEFMRGVPFLGGIAGFFDLQGELSVGGSSLDSSEARLAYGGNSNRAIGFIPIAVNQNVISNIVETVEEIGGLGILVTSMQRAEHAERFLSEYPQFDLTNGESLVTRAFSSEGLIDFQEFRSQDVDRSSRFAEIFSRILMINRLHSLR